MSKCLTAGCSWLTSVRSGTLINCIILRKPQASKQVSKRDDNTLSSIWQWATRASRSWVEIINNAAARLWPMLRIRNAWWQFSVAESNELSSLAPSLPWKSSLSHLCICYAYDCLLRSLNVYESHICVQTPLRVGGSVGDLSRVVLWLEAKFIYVLSADLIRH